MSDEGFVSARAAASAAPRATPGNQGSAAHNFNQLGVIKISKNEIEDDEIFELAIDAGADECISKNEMHLYSTEYVLKLLKMLIHQAVPFQPLRFHRFQPIQHIL